MPKIILKDGIPPIGSPEFEEYTRAEHARLNAPGYESQEPKKLTVVIFSDDEEQNRTARLTEKGRNFLNRKKRK